MRLGGTSSGISPVRKWIMSKSCESMSWKMPVLSGRVGVWRALHSGRVGRGMSWKTPPLVRKYSSGGRGLSRDVHLITLTPWRPAPFLH